jgi:hypothetical protein
LKFFCQEFMKHFVIISLLFVAGVLILTGCQGIPAPGEKQARRDVAAVSNLLQAPFPALPTNATLREAVTFALRNQPQVTAAYADWAASVENITVARSLPDPQLTFEFYAHQPSTCTAV